MQLKKTVYFTVILGLVFFISLPGMLHAKTANDTYFDELYYLQQINAPQAWDYTTGSADVIVAVIDTGVDIDHPDLYQNIWRNQDEIPGDQIDNDQNGYIDDVHGWDFIRNQSDPNPKFDDSHSNIGIEHGTLVSGILGAQGNNNYGITGLNWQVSIMPLVALDGQGNGSITDVIKAIEYAIANQADIINLSLVGMNSDPLLELAIQTAYEHGLVVVAASGNETAGDEGQDNSVDLDTQPRYPICIDNGQNLILGTGSVGPDDTKSVFSNYGSSCMDISAPGERFYGLTVYQPTLTDYQQKFSGYWSGTSLATPLVSGTAALMKAYRSDMTNAQIYELLIQQAHNIDDINPQYAGELGSGRLDLANIFDNISTVPTEGDMIAVSARQHAPPIVKLFTTTGQLTTQFYAYNQNFTGGVNLTAGDIDTDGLSEIITAAGNTGGPHVRIFDQQGNLKRQFFALDKQNSHGVKVAVMNNRVVAWSQDGSYPYVQIFTASGELLNQFKFTQQIDDILAADIDQDGYTELNILSAQNIYIYNQLGHEDDVIQLPHPADKLAVADQYMITSAGAGNPPQVHVYDYDFQLVATWEAYAAQFEGGVAVDYTAQQIVTVPGAGGGPHVRVFDPQGNLISQFFAFDNSLTGGLNVEFVD